MPKHKRYSWSLPPSYTTPNKLVPSGTPWIPVGAGKSYGDSNFNQFGFTRYVDEQYISLDNDANCIVSSNIDLRKVVNFLKYHGLQLPVLPGSCFVTVGGAIASDIHGKSSYHHGSFASNVVGFWLRIDNEEFYVDRKSLWWKFTVAGQGLTGLITKAILKTQILRSTTITNEVKFYQNTGELLINLKDQTPNHDLSVGWIKGFTSKRLVGYNHFVNYKSKGSIGEDFNPRVKIKNWMPAFDVINDLSIRIYSKLALSAADRINHTESDLWDYVFPNSNWGNWNYLFGNKGFHEIQFNAPFDEADRLADLIEEIKRERTCFLIGVKVMRGEPEGVFSFLRNGYSVAINFKTFKNSAEFVNSIYSRTISLFESRVHLTKDWALTRNNLNLMFPEIEKFREFRIENNLKGLIDSNFSIRNSI